METHSLRAIQDFDAAMRRITARKVHTIVLEDAAFDRLVSEMLDGTSADEIEGLQDGIVYVQGIQIVRQKTYRAQWTTDDN